MAKTPSSSLPVLLKEAGSTSGVDNPSDSISECLINVSLPQELITEILVRLPVKSLLRFKCVSKPWLSLISDPQFIRSHFSKSSSTADADGLNLELLFTTTPTPTPTTSMMKCSLYSALHEAHPSEHVSSIEFPSMRYLIGIINGLVCLKLEGTHDFCVWNPALNKLKHFNAPPSVLRGIINGLVHYSFGYEESNDDYKVVCLQYAGEGNDVEVHIYSLKTDSWRRIDQLLGFYPQAVFANGKIYWFAPSKSIVSLDMSSEKFLELQPPYYDAGNCVFWMEESVGRPLLLCDCYKGKKVDLWVLDKGQVDESWCKFISFPYNDVNLEMFSLNYWVLCILSNGEIVFGDRCGLLVYDWKKKEYRNITVTADAYVAAVYVESLVWPNYA